ncbi:hypothetical protein [Candidatus Liberibacter sp.]|nr:hypothetical protein [Candidatus Liberibacter sp.]MBA5724274.1 hypothetical protein [Candidatus Liberibacter sp.]
MKNFLKVLLCRQKMLSDRRKCVEFVGRIRSIWIGLIYASSPAQGGD